MKRWRQDGHSLSPMTQLLVYWYNKWSQPLLILILLTKEP